MIAAISSGRILAIADIHGCYCTFMALLEQLHLQKNDNLFITGDMINRGRGTKNVIKELISLNKKGYRVFPIRGNHEQTLIETFSLEPAKLLARSKKYNNEWLVKKDGSVKEKYYNFFTQLPYFYVAEELYFVHGGFDFSLEKPFDDFHSMLYSRGTINAHSLLPHSRVVHGHTPTALSEIRQKAAHKAQVIGIDNGCVLGAGADFGNLLCLNARSMELFVQKNIE